MGDKLLEKTWILEICTITHFRATELLSKASADYRYYLKQEQLCHHVDCLGDSPDDDGDEEPGHGGGEASRPHDQVQEGQHPDSLGTTTCGPCACCSSERFRSRSVRVVGDTRQVPETCH